MRICLICTEKLPLPPVRGGAIQAYIAGVLPFLSARHQVTCVSRTDPLLPEIEWRDGVRYVRFPAEGGPPAYYRQIAAWLRTEGFDMIEVFNRPAYLPALAAAAPGARILLSLHNDMMAPDRISPAEARQVLQRVDAVIAISDYIRTGVDTWWPGHAHKLRTIRSGVDTDAFRPAWEAPERRAEVRRTLGISDGRPVVLHVSRLSPKKGNHILVEAMGLVRRIRPEALLLAVGSKWYGSDDGDQYSCWLREHAVRTLGEGVIFTGFVPPPGIPDLCLAGDLFVCASQWQEPLARVHYEAMAAGLPIVTTDRGGNGEVAEENGNCLIARPHDDPAAFAAHICRLLDDPALRERLGRRGRELALAQYAWDRVARDLLAVIDPP